MLIIVGTIRIDPANRSVLETAFDKMRAATLQEPCYVKRVGARCAPYSLNRC